MRKPLQQRRQSDNWVAYLTAIHTRVELFLLALPEVPRERRNLPSSMGVWQRSRWRGGMPRCDNTVVMACGQSLDSYLPLRSALKAMAFLCLHRP